MTALLHDAIVAVFIVAGMWALGSEVREGIDKALLGRRRRKAWSRK